MSNPVKGHRLHEIGRGLHTAGVLLVELLRQRPLACACLSYLAGCAVIVIPPPGSLSTGSAIVLVLSPAVVALAFWIAVPFLQQRRSSLPSFTWQRLRGPLALFSAYLSGLVLALHGTAVPSSDLSYLASAHLVMVTGSCLSEHHVTPFGVAFTLESTNVVCGQESHQVTGRAEVWAPTYYHSHRLQAGPIHWPRSGDEVEITGVIQSTAGSSRLVDANLHLEQINAVLRVAKGGQVRILPRHRWSLLRACELARRWILAGLRPFLTFSERSALAGMLFHQKEDIDPGVLDDLQLTGTIHIVATAGLHVGIFLGACLLVLQPLLPRRGAVVLAMTLLVGYCIACGGHPAAFRATLMAELYLLAWLLGRLPDSTTCLTLAAAVMVTLNPYEILQPGFQFTFLTMAVIFMVLPLLEPDQDDQVEHRGRMERALHHLRGIAALSVAAQLGSLPLTASYFGIISLIGLPANLLIVPLLMAIIPLALATAILAPLIPSLAATTGLLLHALIALLLQLAHFLAHVRLAAIPVEGIPWLAVVGYYIILFAGLGWVRLEEGRRG